MFFLSTCRPEAHLAFFHASIDSSFLPKEASLRIGLLRQEQQEGRKNRSSPWKESSSSFFADARYGPVVSHAAKGRRRPIRPPYETLLRSRTSTRGRPTIHFIPRRIGGISSYETWEDMVPRSNSRSHRSGTSASLVAVPIRGNARCSIAGRKRSERIDAEKCPSVARVERQACIWIGMHGEAIR